MNHRSSRRALISIISFALSFLVASKAAHATSCSVGTGWGSRDDDGDGICNQDDLCPYEPDPTNATASDGVTGAACQMQAITVPWVPTNPSLPHITYAGKAVHLKGIARYGSPTQFKWDYGDGTSKAWTAIGGTANVNPNVYDLGVTHTYNGNIGQLYIATLSIATGSVGTPGNIATATYPIKMQQCSSTTTTDPNQMDVCVAVAEDEALWNMHVSMSRSRYADGASTTSVGGSPDSNASAADYYQRYGNWGSDTPGSCATLDAFQLHGSKPIQTNYDVDPYVEDAMRSTAWMIHQMRILSITGSLGTGPDGGTNVADLTSDRSGVGVYISDGNDIYTGGICAAAFSSSGLPGIVAKNGPAHVYGKTFGYIAQEMVDWFAWGQNDGTGSTAGGWLYTANSGSADGSTNQWPIIGMSAAENNMGATIPGFVRAQIPYFLNTIHNTTAGSTYGAYGYSSAGQHPNIAKTSGGILTHFFLGNGNSYPDVQKGLGFLYSDWSTSPSGWDHYNLGTSYAMYDVMKAMSAANPKFTRITKWDQTNNVQASNSFDWYYTPAGQTQTGLATNIVPRQASDGSWSDSVNTNGISSRLATAWDELILAKAVTNIPPQAAICNCSAQWAVNSPITLDGTCSTEPDQTKAIIAYKWDFSYDGTTFHQSCFTPDGTATESCDAGTNLFGVQGSIVTKPDGFNMYTETLDGGPTSPPVSFPVALQVTDNTSSSQGGEQTSVTTCNVIIKPPPHCPQGSAGGPYLASINNPVQLTAAGSTQVDGDPMTYVWDFNNTNNFNDGGSSTLINPTITYDAGGTYPIEVQVTNHPPLSDAGVTPGCSVVAYTTVIVGAHAPIASAGGPYTGTAGEVVQLDGSKSVTADPGDTITYHWDLTGAGTYTDSTIVNPTFTVPSNATSATQPYSICIKVIDTVNNKSSISCTTLTVISQHAAPTCVTPASVVQSCTGGAVTVTLDGTHSYDSQGDSFTYSWVMSDGGPSITNPTAAMASTVIQTAAEGCTYTATASLSVENKYSDGGPSTCNEQISIVDNQTPAFTYTPVNTAIECDSNAVANVNTWLSHVRASEPCAAVGNPVTIANDFIADAGCGGIGALHSTSSSATVTWTAIDPCNAHTAKTVATVTMQDTQPPALTLPADKTVEATGSTGATVTYTATALDAAEGSESVVCTPPSGSVFAIGSNTVSCHAQDSTGNYSSGTFKITVVDTTPPAISGLVNKTAEAGSTVAYTPTATDAVDGTDAVTCSPVSGSVFSYGVTTVTCSSTDAHHNTSSGTFTVTTTDTTPPTLTLPANKTVEATGAFGAIVSFVATANDIVDGADGVTCLPGSGSGFALGTTTVYCSSTDHHGNTSYGNFTITVQDTTAPVLSLPANQIAEATGSNGATVTFTTTATDLVDGSDPVTCTPSSGSVFALGATTVNCTSTDQHSNVRNGSFTVTVRDTTAPVMSGLSNQIVEATGSNGATVTFTPTSADAVDGATDTVICAPASGTVFALGTTNVTCSSTDQHNNKSTGSFTVTVRDTTAPTMTLPSNQTLEATGSSGATATYTATATDLVDGTDAVTCSPLSSTVFALGTTTVHCSSTDAHGNRATGTFTVTVQDTTPPALSLPSNKTVEATGSNGATVTFAATASDLVDGSRPVTCTPASNTVFAIGVTTVSCTSTDTHSNTSTAGTFTVTVQDTTAPILAGLTNKSVEATGLSGAAVSFNPTATDIVDGTDSVSCTPASATTFAIGTTTVNCTATDHAGNIGHGSFTVTVTDSTPPVLAGLTNKRVEATGPTGAAVSFAPTASDTVDGSDNVTCAPATGSVFALGTTTVNCTATDAHSNSSHGSFTVTVVDTTAPTLSLPSNSTVEATGPNGAAVTFVATASDLVDVTDSVTCVPASGTVFAIRTTTVSCTSTDRHNNTSSAGTFTVTVRDTTAPVVTVSANQVIEATNADGATATFTASAADLVDGNSDVVSCSATSGTTFGFGITTVTCTATDNAHNTGTASFTITVQDTRAPVFAGIPDGVNIGYEATEPAGIPLARYAFNDNPITATDAVDGAVSVTCNPALPTEFALGTTPVSCTATDSHSNQSILSFNIVVVDTTPPALICPSDITVAANGPLGALNLGMDEPTSDAIAAFFANASASDIVDSSPSLTNSAPWLFPANETTAVTFTATDAHRNVSTCTANVTVTSEPVAAPTLTCPTNLNVTSGGGQEVDWSAVFRHPVDVQLVMMSGAASGTPLSLSDLGTSAVQLSSTQTTGSYSVRLRAIDQFNGMSVDCNSFVTVPVGASFMPAERSKHTKRSSIPAAPIRN